jgi:hypothetical protein
MPSFLRAFRYRPSNNALTTATIHIKLRGEAQPNPWEIRTLYWDTPTYEAK